LLISVLIFIQETQLEYDVIAILERADATVYLPQFARHRISIETLQQMSHDDLSKVRL
jgi:SAM domain (Sterile alpha motif)